jgi:hypothetical protein
MSANQKANQIVNDLAETLTKINLSEFFKKIHSECYPEYDISFMEYFLEICDKDDEFVIHHSKLVEYGIMTSNDSHSVIRKLDRLKMIEGKHFTLHQLVERGKSGSQIHKDYHITPEAFKKCLMRATKTKDQPINPDVYCDYYLLLEKVFKWYNAYEKKYLQKLLSNSNDTIKELNKNIQELVKRDDESKKRDEAQSKQIAELLGYAKDTSDKLHDVSDELIVVSDKLTTVETEVVVAKTYLEEKSFTSTKNPKNDKLHHYFAVTTYTCGDKKIGKMISGQKGYVNGEIKRLTTPNLIIKCGKGKNAKQHKHSQKLLFGPVYNANGIDLRQNVMTKYNLVIRDVIEDLNVHGQAKINVYNENLKTEITTYNATNRNAIQAKTLTRRSIVKERLKYVKLKVTDVPITFGSMIFTHEPNDIFSYDRLLKIVESMNEETQKSPLMEDGDIE